MHIGYWTTNHTYKKAISVKGYIALYNIIYYKAIARNYQFRLQ